MSGPSGLYNLDVPDAALERADYDPGLTELVADAVAGWQPPRADLPPDRWYSITSDSAPSPASPSPVSPLLLTSRWRPGLAASSGSSEVLIDRHGTAGVTVTRRVFADMGLVDITVESTHAYPHHRFPILGLYRRSLARPQPCLLFLMTDGEPIGHLQRSEVRLPHDSSLTSDELMLYDTPVEAAELPAALLPVVTHTIGVAKLAWKEAWRQAALATPPDHPLREAVTQGLRVQPASR